MYYEIISKNPIYIVINNLLFIFFYKFNPLCNKVKKTLKLLPFSQEETANTELNLKKQLPENSLQIFMKFSGTKKIMSSINSLFKQRPKVLKTVPIYIG